MKKENIKNNKKEKGYSKLKQPAQNPVNKKGYAYVSGFAMIILLGIIIYSNSFNGTFHFDDLPHIVWNTKIRDLFDIKTVWNYSPNRPVGIFTFALDYHFNRLDVWYWHLTNLAIHLMNGLLVGWLSLLIFSSPAMKDNQVVRYKGILALFTALLFVSHPLATQAVNYIVQRETSLAALFYLLSLSLYLKARLSGTLNISKYYLFAGSLVSAVLAMLSKENAFTLPFAILLIEFFFLREKKFSLNFRDYRVVFLAIAFLATILIIPLKYSFSIFDAIPPGEGHPYTLTPVNYFFTQCSVIVKYIQLLFLPVNQILVYNYPVSNSFFEFRTLSGFLLLLSLLVLAILIFKRNRIISFGIFWFFLTLVIESSFIPIADVIFEHRTYLPSFGFCLIVSSGLFLILREKNKIYAIGLLMIYVGLYSLLTYERNKVWRNDITLWSDNIEKTPDFARPVTNRAFAYERSAQWQNAILDYSKAIAIDSSSRDPYIQRGSCYRSLGKWNEAVKDYSRVLVLDPKYKEAYLFRGIAYGNLNMTDKALVDFSKAIDMDPKFVKGYFNRGVTYGKLSLWDKAISDYSTAIGIDPEYKEAYFNRGIAFGQLGQLNEAIEDFSMAIEIDPKYKEAYLNRGVAYAQFGRWDKAIEEYSKALDIDPKYTEAYNNRVVAYKNVDRKKE